MGVADYKHGKPIMVDYTPSSILAAGDVVVIGATPFVSHVDNPMFTGATRRDALAARGGVYQVVTDGTPRVGQDVYFVPSTNKFTATAAGNVHFGVCMAGPSLDVAGASPAADNDLALVSHSPGASPGGVDMTVRSEATQSTTATLTAAQLLGGMINSAPAAAITLTFPTAANMVAGIRGCAVGDSFDVTLTNTSGGANTITLAAGGATLRGNTSVAQNKSALLRVLITNVTASSEAYTVHSVVSA